MDLQPLQNKKTKMVQNGTKQKNEQNWQQKNRNNRSYGDTLKIATIMVTLLLRF
jgi:hypothetical protein